MPRQDVTMSDRNLRLVDGSPLLAYLESEEETLKMARRRIAKLERRERAYLDERCRHVAKIGHLTALLVASARDKTRSPNDVNRDLAAAPKSRIRSQAIVEQQNDETYVRTIVKAKSDTAQAKTGLLI